MTTFSHWLIIADTCFLLLVPLFVCFESFGRFTRVLSFLPGCPASGLPGSLFWKQQIPVAVTAVGQRTGSTYPPGQYRLLQTDQAGHMEMSPCCTQGHVLALWGKTGRRHGAGLSDWSKEQRVWNSTPKTEHRTDWRDGKCGLRPGVSPYKGDIPGLQWEKRDGNSSRTFSMWSWNLSSGPWKTSTIWEEQWQGFFKESVLDNF